MLCSWEGKVLSILCGNEADDLLPVPLINHFLLGRAQCMSSKCHQRAPVRKIFPDLLYTFVLGAEARHLGRNPSAVYDLWLQNCVGFMLRGRHKHVGSSLQTLYFVSSMCSEYSHNSKEDWC